MNAGIEDFPHFLRAFEAMRTEGGWELSNRADAREFLVGTFSRDEEWGLLNRLDTDTSGMLYFARSREVYEQWRERQRAGKVKKWYLAQVEGKIAWKPREMKEVEGSEGSEEIVGAQFFVSGWGDES